MSDRTRRICEFGGGVDGKGKRMVHSNNNEEGSETNLRLRLRLVCHSCML